MSLSWKRLIRFLLFFAVGCLAAFAIWVAVVFFVYNTVTTHDEYWVEAIMERKKAAAEKREGGRLLVVAGSTGWYGFRVATLEQTLGVPVANMAIHAGLSIIGVCSDALAVMRPGDAVLMAFEYEQFSRDPFQYRSMAHMLRVHPWALTRLPPLEGLRYVMTPPLSEFAFRWQYRKRIQNGEDVFAFSREIISLTDEEGEITERNEKYGKPVNTRLLTRTLEPFNPAALETMASYIRQFQKRGAVVFATYPPRLMVPDYDRAQVKEHQAAVRAFYESHGVTLVGEPRIATEQGDEFFDNSGHLTAKAARERSRLVGGLLLETPAFQQWKEDRPR